MQLFNSAKENEIGSEQFAGSKFTFKITYVKFPKVRDWSMWGKN